MTAVVTITEPIFEVTVTDTTVDVAVTEAPVQVTISDIATVGDASQVPYAPDNPARWLAAPANVGAALDEIADRGLFAIDGGSS